MCQRSNLMQLQPDIGETHMSLKTSHPDTFNLSQSVQTRFLELCDLYMRVTEQPLQVPEDMKSAFKLWRQMHVRFTSRDLRNTKDEEQALRDVAQWTLDRKNELCNQPKKTLEWVDHFTDLNT